MVNRRNQGARPGNARPNQVQQRKTNVQSRGNGWMANTLNVVKTGIVEFFTLFFGWIASNHCLGAASFIVSIMCRYFHWSDELIKDSSNEFLDRFAALSAPSIAVFVSIVIGAITGQGQTRSFNMAAVLGTYSCSGSLAGHIVDELMKRDGQSEVTYTEMRYVCMACAAISFLVTVLNSDDWRITLKASLFRFALIILVWSCVLPTLFPLSSISHELPQFALFTLALGIIEYSLESVRPLGNQWVDSLLPFDFIGCFVKSFGMLSVVIYYFSWRIDSFSQSWLSFSWVIKSGPLVCGVAFTCYVIHWMCEKMLGPGKLRESLFSLVVYGIASGLAVFVVPRAVGMNGEAVWTSVGNALVSVWNEYVW